MRTLVFALAIVAVAACTKKEEPQQSSPPPAASDAATSAPPPEGQAPAQATATLAPASGSQVRGELMISADQEGVHITGVVTGLEPNSEHGFHIHEKGDCSAPDASSAGAHFNPGNAPHGHPDSPAKHAGDMLNIRANADGVAKVDVHARGATLRTGEPTDVMNKAIVVHAKPDDYKSQPSGNSGDRIACGVIQ